MRVDISKTITYMDNHGGGNLRIDRQNYAEAKTYESNKSKDANKDGSITLSEYYYAQLKARGIMNPNEAESKVIGHLEHADKALNSPIDSERFTAMENLKTADPQIVFRALTLALNDPNMLVRAAAASALGEIKDKQAVTYLLSSLTDDQAAVRFTAARSLAVLVDETDPESLAISISWRVEKETYLPARLQLIRVLEKLDSARAIMPLVRLMDDHDATVQRAAALAVIIIKRGKSTPAHTLRRAREILLNPKQNNTSKTNFENPYRGMLRYLPKKRSKPSGFVDMEEIENLYPYRMMFEISHMAPTRSAVIEQRQQNF